MESESVKIDFQIDPNPDPVVLKAALAFVGIYTTEPDNEGHLAVWIPSKREESEWWLPSDPPGQETRTIQACWFSVSEADSSFGFSETMLVKYNPEANAYFVYSSEAPDFAWYFVTAEGTYGLTPATIKARQA